MSESLGEHGWWVNDEKSVIQVTLDGQAEMVINHGSDMDHQIFYSEPGATMTVDGIEFALHEGMNVKVPLGTAYTYQGQAEMIVTARPPFKLEHVEVIQR